jgi:multidrug efflux pump subunit AcrB
MDDGVKKIAIIAVVAVIVAVGGIFAYKNMQGSNAMPPPDKNPVEVNIPEPGANPDQTAPTEVPAPQ